MYELPTDLNIIINFLDFNISLESNLRDVVAEWDCRVLSKLFPQFGQYKELVSNIS